MMNIIIHPNEILNYGDQFYFNNRLVTFVDLKDTGFRYSNTDQDADQYFGIGWKSISNSYVTGTAFVHIGLLTKIETLHFEKSHGLGVMYRIYS